MSERDAYVGKMKARLDEWSAEIEVLEARAAHARASARAEYERQMRQLREQASETADQLRELRDGGESAWNELKGGVEQAMGALGDAVKRAHDQLR
ncbi:MAG TPA: hypothetical protein ENN87_13115 [Phycisphaerales bacterium]|nr:hypothetical protein [Phycisphaerales bacterium]